MLLNKKQEKGANIRSTGHLKLGKSVLGKSPKAVCLDQAEEPRNPIWDIEGKKKKAIDSQERGNKNLGNRSSVVHIKCSVNIP